MLELQRDSLVFTFPEIHPQARLEITFQRTLRIPDDGKNYPLPPGLGKFPVRHIDDHKDRVPEKWLKRGGVMVPMYQSEALWVSFNSQYITDHETPYPFAVKIGAGKRSAVTGKPWSKELREKDYCVIPGQPWIDGFVVDEGTIRQFVAMPLGMGVTAEAQLSGKEEFGGIQIEVLPMDKAKFLKRFPKRERVRRSRLAGVRSLSFNGDDDDLVYGSFEMQTNGKLGASFASVGASMGLGAGGKMHQEIYEDKYGMSEWDTEASSRCFVHLANSIAWRAITKEAPPETPVTAAEYARYGLPWYDHYNDGAAAIAASGKMKGLKSILEMGYQKGISGLITENESVEVKSDKVVSTTGTKRPGEVRDGVWK